MTLDARQFFRATNPDRALFADDRREEDEKYYIDFSSVRGGKVIDVSDILFAIARRVNDSLTEFECCCDYLTPLL